MKDNIEGAQLIVRIILGDDSIVVKRVETQKEYKNLSEHSFCFDVYAEDANGKNMEVEVQRKSNGAVPERAKGVEAMCEIWEEVRSEGIAAGRAEGLTEAINNLMQTTGWTVEKVMEALNIPKVEWEKYKAAVQE